MERVFPSRISVLLVEADPAGADLLRRRLDRVGGLEAVSLEVHQATTLAEGIERLSRGSIDVVLLDLELPDGDRDFKRYIGRPSPS